MAADFYIPWLGKDYRMPKRHHDGIKGKTLCTMDSLAVQPTAGGFTLQTVHSSPHNTQAADSCTTCQSSGHCNGRPHTGPRSKTADPCIKQAQGLTFTHCDWLTLQSAHIPFMWTCSAITKFSGGPSIREI